MSLEAEKLLETVLDLERSRKRERNLRIESEALLQGLREITGAKDREQLFQALMTTLHSVLDFEEGFILRMNDDGSMSSLVSTCQKLRGSFWQPASVFTRVMGGRPIASFDIDQVPEWMQQPAAVRENIRSALHMGLEGGTQKAILVVTHSEPKHFGPTHIKQIHHFVPLASQALVTLELQKAVIQRDRFFELSMDLMGIVDYTGLFKQFNNSWETLLGYGCDQLQGCRLYDLVHKDDIEQVKKMMKFVRQSEEKHLIEVRFKSRAGGDCWLSCSVAPYPDEQLCYIVARDVTDRVIFEKRLSYNARHDSLSGLYNRAEFLERLSNAFARCKRQPDYQFAVFYLDLNKFKEINDTLGHGVGDELLKHVSQCLLSVAREVDTIARLGGDEFAILLDNIQSKNNLADIATRIHTKLAQPVEINGNVISAVASIGIALSSLNDTNPDEVVRRADEAMYQAKSSERDYYVINNDG